MLDIFYLKIILKISYEISRFDAYIKRNLRFCIYIKVYDNYMNKK